MTPRTLTIGLIVSAGLNLFLIGGIGGVMLIGHRLGAERMAAAPAQRAPLWRAGDGLTPQHQQSWRQALRSHALSAGPTLRQARDVRRTAWESLLKPDFDIAKAKAELARARALDGQGRAVVEDAILDYAASLPMDEREALLEGLKRVAPARAGLAPPQRRDREQ